MANTDPDYDVVIVGGRPAGATLAMRLGARGHRVLLIDRASFPSLPSVPSSAGLFPGTLAILDELGIPEASYAAGAVKLRGFSFQFADAFDTFMPMPPVGGRDYLVGLDRSRFDEVVWRSVARYPSVTQREQFTMTELLRDPGGRVVGVIGSEHGGELEQIRARCVVGADGRFSLVARKVGAQVVEEDTKTLSTVYFAAWENVPSFYEGVPSFHVHATGRGLDIPFIEVPDGRTLVNTHHRADRVEIGGDAQAYYMATLNSVPAVARRLQGATQVSEVLGIKRVGNGYRESSGPGWVLVGDAAHYKDPIDGQGMYDAILGARLLDQALAPWLAGEHDWGHAMAEYQRELHTATHPMFVETVGRLRRELYAEPPTLVIKTLIRWLMTDPAYQAQFMSYLCRTISPTGWASGRLVGGAVLRGLLRDLRGSQGALLPSRAA